MDRKNQPQPLDLDQVCQLIADRSAGKASNEQVEQAVSQLLKQQQQQQHNTDPKDVVDEPSPSVSNNHNIRSEHESHEIHIEHDMGDYDDDGDENDGRNEETKPPASTELNQTRPDQTRTAKTTRTTTKQAKPQQQTKFNPSLYQDIPLGIQGAQMMIAFGDGRYPQPDAVQAALLGARRMLLVAIQDARHVRRNVVAAYQQARVSLLHHSKKIKKPKRTNNKRKRASTAEDGGQAAGDTTGSTNDYTTASVASISSRLLFQVQVGTHNDPSVRTPACGFGTQELFQLFPEEMNAFARWNQMKHEADEKQQQSSAAAKTATDEKEKSDIEGTEKQQDHDDQEDEPQQQQGAVDPVVVEGGHIRDRMEQFDVRTEEMKKDWYLKFTDVRHKGSFLPPRCSSTAAAEWDRMQAQKANAPLSPPASKSKDDGSKNDSSFATASGKQEEASAAAAASASSPPHASRRGRRRAGAWSHMSFVEVRFLHWVGFIGSANSQVTADATALSTQLLPPDGETTEALGFLGYDFFGRIVEKAIALRNERKQQQDQREHDEPELRQQQHQLTEQDIAAAMEHADIKPIPIYQSNSNNNRKAVGTQLYFGPGFEDRMEMELEEMVARGAAGGQQKQDTTRSADVAGNHEKEQKEDDAQEEEEDVEWRIREDGLFERLLAQAPASEQELVALSADLANAKGNEDENNNDTSDKREQEARKYEI